MGRSSGQDTGEPLLGFQYRVEVSGKVKATGYFTEVGGVGSENEVVDHKVVKDGHEIIQKIPGRLKWTDVTLKRGITTDMSFWEWRQLVIEGKLSDARSSVSIVMLDRDYQDLARWEFTNAWPSKLTGPSFKSDSNEFGVEELAIVHEGMTRKK